MDLNAPPELTDAAQRTIDTLRRSSLTLVTAESCTCGLLCSILGKGHSASEVLHGGFITYSKTQKTVALGVPASVLEDHSAVSEPVARMMAEGALSRSSADLAVAVTGVAGPSADEDGNPVGLVHIAVARRERRTVRGQERTVHEEKRYGGVPPGVILEQAVKDALELVSVVARDRSTVEPMT